MGELRFVKELHVVGCEKRQPMRIAAIHRLSRMSADEKIWVSLDEAQRGRGRRTRSRLRQSVLRSVAQISEFARQLSNKSRVPVGLFGFETRLLSSSRDGSEQSFERKFDAGRHVIDVDSLAPATSA